MTRPTVGWASALRFTPRHSRRVHKILLSVGPDSRRAVFASTYAWLLDEPAAASEQVFWRELRMLADALNELPDTGVETLRVLMEDGWTAGTAPLIHAARTL